VLQWGRLSDKIGRRPVLIACTLGVASTVIAFGLSTTFTRLALCRAFEGLLSGNSGTIKAILAELTVGDEHQMARVFSLMPVVWAVGAAIG
jgi:MFS family permease